ncbi:hypothetical protein K492DRAFT_191356 [Lichtheimia hyalospora FSU 10163]|nr:hypothetical protein K492DRAFT_191356 [Lichtheimia hyalospora FSU 10163]
MLKEKCIDRSNSSSSNFFGSASSLSPQEILICATHGNVYALQKRDGTPLWKVESPTGTAMSGILSIFVVPESRHVLVAGGGKTACLDMTRGHTVWMNKMEECGHEPVGLTVMPNTQHHLTSSETGSRNNSYDDTSMQDEQPPGYDEATQSSIVVACTNGKCLGINLHTGSTVWRFDCPGGGEEFPNALMDPLTGRVYVGCGKYVYCLQAKTGVIIWSRKISKSIIPGGYMVLATANHNAQANSSFNQFPVPHVNEEG